MNHTNGYRLLAALAAQHFTRPTPVQAAAIPLVLQGKDVLVRAKTGSGKTAAYLLPILQAILARKGAAAAAAAESASETDRYTSALVLVPTRELAEQVCAVVGALAARASRAVRALNLAQKAGDGVLRAQLADAPDVVVATPARALASVNASALSLARLRHLVVDEADLVLSYGYEEDMRALQAAVPRGVQTVLVSATLTAEVETLKGLFCRSPVVVKLEEREEAETITQYAVK
ncbi:ATP-dependent DNA/RNA helicase [Ascosphaera acerosa]|nr:ATP-dependent DNA/RNA helicase [Ascosphaera acerosa]